MTELRPEELVVEIYRQLAAAREQGDRPDQVTLSMKQWRSIRAWHAARGVMEQAPHMDYITEDSIFGLDVMIDGVSAPRVS